MDHLCSGVTSLEPLQTQASIISNTSVRRSGEIVLPHMRLDKGAGAIVLVCADLIKNFMGNDMARKRISSSDLIWMFHEGLNEYDDHTYHGISLAIIPGEKGNWRVVTQRKLPKREPDMKVRIGKIEKKLRRQYALARDWGSMWVHIRLQNCHPFAAGWYFLAQLLLAQGEHRHLWWIAPLETSRVVDQCGLLE
jgi:hypothetical protein